MNADSRDIAECATCRRPEHIDLLDAKPEPGGDQEDFTRLECVVCYGPGWLPATFESISRSVRPDLASLYQLIVSHHEKADAAADKAAQTISTKDTALEATLAALHAGTWSGEQFSLAAVTARGLMDEIAEALAITA